jgi:hypothetical protein
MLDTTLHYEVCLLGHISDFCILVYKPQMFYILVYDRILVDNDIIQKLNQKNPLRWFCGL